MNGSKQNLKLLAVDNFPEDCEVFVLMVNGSSNRYHISQWEKARDLNETFECMEKADKEGKFDLIILDIHFGKGYEDLGAEILQKIRESNKHAFYPVVVLTNYSEQKFQERFLKLGVDGFLDKEHDRDRTSLSSVEYVIERSLKIGKLRKDYFKNNYGIRKERSHPEGEDSVDLFGISDPMRQLFHQIFRTVADDLSPNVLIQGDTGTGKSSVARAIWALGPRSKKPFKELVTNTISPGLVASELFGHKRGAFTGAITDKKGLIEACQGGTLFLDEIGDLPLDVQVMLLQALREKKIRRLGSEDFIKVDFQLISATNHNLDELIKLGKFRADLYHRIRGVQMGIPSLKERFKKNSEELQKIIDLEQASSEFRFRFTPKAKYLLQNHTWPGNYAELKTLISELTTLCSTVADDEMVGQRLLKPEYFSEKSEASRVEDILTNPNYHNALRELQDIYIKHWMAECGGVVEEVAKKIGVNTSTIHRWKKRRSEDSKSESKEGAEK